MVFDEESDQVSVFEEAGQAFLENVSHLVFVYHGDEDPKSDCGVTVHEQLSDYEVHALYIVNLPVLAGIRPKHHSQSVMALCSFLEKLISGESSAQIALNLGCRYFAW